MRPQRSGAASAGTHQTCRSPRSFLRRGSPDDAYLIVTVHSDMLLRGDMNHPHPLASIFQSGCSMYNHNSTATSGTALAPTYLSHTHVPGAHVLGRVTKTASSTYVASSGRRSIHVTLP